MSKNKSVLKKLATLAMIVTASGIIAGCPKKTYPPLKSPPDNPCRVYCGGQTDDSQKRFYADNSVGDGIYSLKNSREDSIYNAS